MKVVSSAKNSIGLLYYVITFVNIGLSCAIYVIISKKK